MDTPGRFHLAAHETNYLSQKTRFRPSSDETNLINVITRCNETGCLTGRQGGDGGCTNNLCTYSGLLAPSGWTDYGSGTAAGLAASATMTKPDRVALQVAAVVGAAFGGVTGYLLSNLVESGGWLKILIWALIGAVVVTGIVFCLRAFRS